MTPAKPATSIIWSHCVRSNFLDKTNHACAFLLHARKARSCFFSHPLQPHMFLKGRCYTRSVQMSLQPIFETISKLHLVPRTALLFTRHTQHTPTCFLCGSRLATSMRKLCRASKCQSSLAAQDHVTLSGRSSKPKRLVLATSEGGKPNRLIQNPGQNGQRFVLSLINCRNKELLGMSLPYYPNL
jgi:hypothetical protein